MDQGECQRRPARNRKPSPIVISPYTRSGLKRKQPKVKDGVKKQKAAKEAEAPSDEAVEDDDCIEVGAHVAKPSKPLHLPHVWPETKAPILRDTCERLVGTIIPLMSAVQPQRYVESPSGVAQFLQSEEKLLL